MKTVVSTLLMLGGAVLFVVIPAVVPVHAQCTDATLAGSYAFVWQAFTTKHGVQGQDVPWAGTGKVTFDGAGNSVATWTTSLDGTILTSQSGAGPYTVNADCSGNWTLTTGDAAGFSANLQIASGGAEVFGVDTGAGDTASFTLKKQ